MPYAAAAQAVLGGLSAHAQAEAGGYISNLQAATSRAEIEANERMFEKQLEFDKEKSAFLIQQQEPKKPDRAGSISFPYVTMVQPKKKPSPMPIIILLGGGVVWFLFLRKG